ncbi:Putative IS3-like transposase [Cronobacter universalis NCTC 9529]|uniref:Integrase core domain n=1 Tax=Cronobacter universalis NCTC 9529 TaxID=1074000 RepID=A0ABY1VY28_9ENTR|nr:Putative IS3-like transposase [Cronobacter universalis NCTC 9529]STC99323.1 Integrase core domain [Cronobacter universalis NCTC 9529]
MKRAGIKAQVGYRGPRARKGEASIVAPNRLQRQFNPDSPDVSWVTDITYIRTHEGWLYLAVVVDLFSRKVIGWSMQPRMTKEIVLNALLMAVWRRNPQKQVLVHSDQGSQYTSHEWQSFLKSHGLERSMSRRGNCHDNAVAESFFQLLKRERIKKKIYGARNEARSDIFDYIEMFYNSKRRYGSSEQMPPAGYENLYYQRFRSVWIIRGDKPFNAAYRKRAIQHYPRPVGLFFSHDSQDIKFRMGYFHFSASGCNKTRSLTLRDVRPLIHSLINPLRHALRLRYAACDISSLLRHFLI